MQFKLTQEPFAPVVAFHDPAMAAGDYDNDGDLDLAVTGGEPAGSRFVIFQNNSGSLSAGQEPRGAGLGYQLSALTPGDFNRDGHLDLFTVGFTGNGTVKSCEFYTNSAGAFSVNSQPWCSLGFGYGGGAAGDIDGDGDQDIVFSGFDSGGNKRLIIVTNGTAGFGIWQEPLAGPSAAGAVALADIDNDGDLDMAVAGYGISGRRFFILRNDSGALTPVQEPFGTGIGLWSSSLAFGDLDADGDQDLVATGSDGTDARFIVYRNDNGFFRKWQEPMGEGLGIMSGSEYGGQQAVALGDLDNDGDLDCVVAGNGMGIYCFQVLRNDSGILTYSEEPLGAGNGFGNSAVNLLDLDSDGDLDIAVAGFDNSLARRFMVFSNSCARPNAAPSAPASLASSSANGAWRFSWAPSSDDRTPQKVLRYQIAVGTAPGLFNFMTTNIAYPGGQANIGNVISVTGNPGLRSALSVSNDVWWKVRAIDTSFKSSAWSAVQYRAALMLPKPLQQLRTTSLGTNFAGLAWQRSAGASVYKVYRSPAMDLAAAQVAGKTVATNFTSSGLAPNTVYHFWVVASNSQGEGPVSSSVSNCTLAPNPSVTPARIVNTAYTNPVFWFTNRTSVGTGGSVYEYNWNGSVAAGVTNTDPSFGTWAPLGPTGRSFTAPAEGLWHLHLRSLNRWGRAGPAATWGPYAYFEEYVGPFGLSVSKPRLEPDGADSLLVANTNKLKNIYTASNVSDGMRFRVTLLEGTCDFVNAVLTNGQSVVTSTNGDIRLVVSGRVVNQVRVRVTWEGDASVFAEAGFVVSPTMDLEETSDAVIYENVVDPEKGDALDVYVNAADGETVTVRVYDVLNRRLVRELTATGEYLGHVRYDLKTEDGKVLPDGTYGVVVSGKKWRKSMKFVVSRWLRK
jgi:hypothetical protein